MSEVKQVIAAILLMAIALSTVGYAAASFGTSVTTADVSISASLSNPPTIPKRTTWSNEFTNGLTLSGISGLSASDELQIRVELVVDKTLADGVRNIIAVIDSDGDGDYDTSDVVLTLNKPWSEFSYTLQDADITAGSKSWDVYLIILAGHKTVSGGTLAIIGSVVAFTS